MRGRGLGKSEFARQMLVDYPGKVYHMTAAEVQANQQRGEAQFQAMGAKLNDAFTDQLARALDEAVKKSAGVAGGRQVYQGVPWKGPFENPPVMVEALSLPEQEVMATFNICPQCNREGDTFDLPEHIVQNWGRSHACAECAQFLLDEDQRAAHDREMRRIQSLSDFKDKMALRQMPILYDGKIEPW